MEAWSWDKERCVIPKRLILLAGVVGLAAFVGVGGSAASAADSCPNAAFRQGPGKNLPECRAYEEVSPADKGPYSVQIKSESFRANPAGNSIIYFGNGSFPGGESSLFGTPYLAERGSGDWTSRSLSPPYRNRHNLEFTDAMAISEDNTHTVLESGRALAPGAVEKNFNLYLLDNRTGALELIFSVASDPQLELFRQVGGTPSFDHVIFLDVNALTPGAPENGMPKLYDFTGGHLELVSYVPTGSGEVPAQGSVSTGGAIEAAISRNGARIFFEVTEGSFTGDKGLYMRVDGNESVPLSISQRAGDGSTVRDGIFKDANPDGAVVFFISNEPLTEASEVNESPGFNTYSLYRLDIETDELTDIGVSGGQSALQGESNWADVETNPSGSAAFFKSIVGLRPGDSGEAVYHWSTQDGLKLVADGLLGIMGNTAYRYYFASPNGEWFAFLERASLTGYDNENAAGKCLDSTNGLVTPCQQVYLYSVAREELVCASCRTDGLESQGNDVFGFDQSGHFSIRPLNDDGTVFFTTADRLSPFDSNGRADVYEYRNGSRSLISSGTSNQDSTFVGAGATGADVYFVTAQQLVGQDRDDVFDLYDARVGGGLATQYPSLAPAECVGEECQAPSGPPPVTPIGTRSVGSTAPQCGQYSSQAKKLSKQARHQTGKKRRATQKRAKQMQKKAKLCRVGAA